MCGRTGETTNRQQVQPLSRNRHPLSNADEAPPALGAPMLSCPERTELITKITGGPKSESVRSHFPKEKNSGKLQNSGLPSRFPWLMEFHGNVWVVLAGGRWRGRLQEERTSTLVSGRSLDFETSQS